MNIIVTSIQNDDGTVSYSVSVLDSSVPKLLILKINV